MIQPLHNNILIERLPELSFKSTLFLPEGSVSCNRGKVLAVGPGIRDKKGRRVPCDVQTGDVVVFYELAELHRPSGLPQHGFSKLSKEPVIINESDIQLVLGE